MKHTYARPDGRLVSYPRSGRTWLAFMLTSVKNQLGLPGTELVMKKHDGAMVQKGKAETNPSKAKLYTGRDVILLTRDPRDVVVSLYFMLTARHAKRAEGRYFSQFTLSEFIRSEYGIPHQVRFLNQWRREREVPRKFNVFSYEGLLSNTVQELRWACEFYGVKPSTPVLIKAVEEYSFRRMQQHDRKHLIGEFRLSKEERKDPNTLSVRSGTVGNHKEHLSREDIQWIDEYLYANLCRLYPYW